MSARELAACGPRGCNGAWLRRLGLAGFMFFLAKGIVWLALGSTLWRQFI